MIYIHIYDMDICFILSMICPTFWNNLLFLDMKHMFFCLMATFLDWIARFFQVISESVEILPCHGLSWAKQTHLRTEPAQGRERPSSASASLRSCSLEVIFLGKSAGKSPKYRFQCRKTSGNHYEIMNMGVTTIFTLGIWWYMVYKSFDYHG